MSDTRLETTAPPRDASQASLAALLRSPRGYTVAVSTLSVVALLALWYIGALILPPSVFAAPDVVILGLIEELGEPGIWADIGVTLRRIAFAFVIAMGVSVAMGTAMALSRFAGVFFKIWVITGITIPALVVILTTYMVMGLSESAAVLGAALPVIPILTINIREGVGSIDPKLMEMAQAYRATPRQRYLDVIAPQVAPMLMASARFGLGLVWKMVLFVELLGRSDGIGYRIEFYYQMFNMKMVLIHALSFLIVMLLIEVVIFGTLERRLFRWRAR